MSMPTHSFSRNATLATQPPSSNVCNYAVTPAQSSYYHRLLIQQRDISTQVQYNLPQHTFSLTDHTAGTDDEFSSNARLYETPAQYPHFSGVYHTPHAGLGISFETPLTPQLSQDISPLAFKQHTARKGMTVPVSLPLRIPAGTYIGASTGILHNELEYEPEFCLAPVNSAAILRSYDFADGFGMYGSQVTPMEDEQAYAVCPSNEFATPLHLDSSVSPSATAASQNMEDFVQTHYLLGTAAVYAPVPHSSDEDVTMASPGESVVGLFPDVNFRALAVSQRSPSVGVNPADIMAPSIGDTISTVKAEPATTPTLNPSEILHQTPPRSPSLAPDFPDEALSAIISVLSASIKKEEEEPLTLDPSVLPITTSLLARRRQKSLNSQGLTAPGYATRSAHNSPANTPDVLAPVPRVPIQRSPLVDMTNRPTLNPVQRSPVLNAHQGIELEELRRKADDFRSLNPGRDIDKTWLNAFAGRLSERGELMPEYRCYVNGCTQMNKRRDHILVHVGSHVEYRPFQCDDCGMRFLRKNECKRHTSSHGGLRPYVCLICAPYQDRSFVRQDLLKRHLKVTHGMQSMSGSGEQDRRKRVKLNHDVKAPSFENYIPMAIVQ